MPSSSETELVYLDTSAFVKLVNSEPEQAALKKLLLKYSCFVASELLELESIRVSRRLGSPFISAAAQLLQGIDLIPISHEIFDRAKTIDPVSVGTLDAIHLACALSLQPIQPLFICYDRHLAKAAKGYGLEVKQPGLTRRQSSQP